MMYEAKTVILYHSELSYFLTGPAGIEELYRQGWKLKSTFDFNPSPIDDSRSTRRCFIFEKKC